ncbi:MAG: heme ABC exporter ATP-binding protein CcmA [Thermodesulfobacteriota bacterium]
MVLTLDRVAKFYGDKPVLREVSLALAPGRVLLVAGENGAGKSTLLKVMAGLARPSAGTVRQGVDQARVGYLGHQTFLYPRLSALENLRFWARLFGVPGDEAALVAALDRVGLAAAAHEEAGTFSRGMAQRLSLARVFLTDPRLVFLDEPGTGLDVRSRTVLRAEIAAARERGASLVWVSHALAEDLVGADQVLLLDKGRVAYSGPADRFPANGGAA